MLRTFLNHRLEVHDLDHAAYLATQLMSRFLDQRIMWYSLDLAVHPIQTDLQLGSPPQQFRKLIPQRCSIIHDLTSEGTLTYEPTNFGELTRTTPILLLTFQTTVQFAQKLTCTRL
jgi:hypothetical protein